jgi:hypothetical protein
LNHIYKENFILEQSPYFLSDLKAVLKEDRGDISYGIDYKLYKHIYEEFYINGQAKILSSNTQILSMQRGIEIVDDILENKKDDTNIFIESFDENLFVKDITKVSLGFAITFNFSGYFYTFPISLRKELLFYNYNKYSLTTNEKIDIEEQVIGLKLDVLFFHKLPLPITMKYIKNDYTNNKEKVIISLGMEF